MPGYDQRGPQGAGPRTGGGFGNCAGTGRSGGGRCGRGNAGRRNGAGRCGGRQRSGRQTGGGRRQNAGPVVSGPQGAAGGEIGRLQHRASQLSAELQAIEYRLAAAGDTTPTPVDPASDTSG